MSTSGTTARASALAAALLGTWQLERFVITFDVEDGREPRHPLGERPRGQIVYAPDGHMAALLSRPDRAPLAVGTLEAAGRAEADVKAEAFDGFASYAGHWRVEAAVDGSGGTDVVHTVRMALVPDVVGTELRRRVTFAADASGHGDAELALSYDVTTRRGTTATYTLTWRRPCALSPSPDPAGEA